MVDALQLFGFTLQPCHQWPEQDTQATKQNNVRFPQKQRSGTYNIDSF